mmetsp:Transcript_25165/g.44740  ORF Transcript_25165/g.44740 Transcript_25165/m.44740 type:complete len:337 (-) Transcript_25165:113-1123(-)
MADEKEGKKEAKQQADMGEIGDAKAFAGSMRRHSTFMYESKEMVNKDTTFAVFAPEGDSKGLPVVLFQSGYGSRLEGHTSLCEKIAAEGNIVVVPCRTGDQYCGCCGVWTAMACLLPLNALSSDGKHLELAYDFVCLESKEDSGSKIAGRADLNKVVLSGFSMGGQEVINASALLKGKYHAAAVIDGSLAWSPVLAFHSCCSSLEKKTAALDVPSVWITSEGSLMKTATYHFYGIAGGEPSLVTFKDSVLNLDTPLSYQTTTWWPFLACKCMATCFGISQHFALANEKQDVSHEAVVALIEKTFNKHEFLVDAAKTVEMTPACCCWACVTTPCCMC